MEMSEKMQQLAETFKGTKYNIVYNFNTYEQLQVTYTKYSGAKVVMLFYTDESGVVWFKIKNIDTEASRAQKTHIKVVYDDMNKRGFFMRYYPDSGDVVGDLPQSYDIGQSALEVFKIALTMMDREFLKFSEESKIRDEYDIEEVRKIAKNMRLCGCHLHNRMVSDTDDEYVQLYRKKSK